MSAAGAGSSIEDASLTTETAAQAEWIAENVSMRVCTAPLQKPAKPCAPVKFLISYTLSPDVLELDLPRFQSLEFVLLWTCTFFTSSYSMICQCGHSIDDKSEGRHARAPSPPAASTPSAAWRDDDQFTRALPTNAFGEIEFVNSEQTRAQVYCTVYS